VYLDILPLNAGKNKIYSNSGIVSSEFCLSVVIATFIKSTKSRFKHTQVESVRMIHSVKLKIVK